MSPLSANVGSQCEAASGNARTAAVAVVAVGLGSVRHETVETRLDSTWQSFGPADWLEPTAQHSLHLRPLAQRTVDDGCLLGGPGIRFSALPIVLSGSDSAVTEHEPVLPRGGHRVLHYDRPAASTTRL